MSNARKITLAIVSVFFMQGASYGAIQEVGDLNVIDMAGNPSDGLRYLDMSYSIGLSLGDALTAAQPNYPNARVATPGETDDLFSAAGIVYNDSAFPASAGYLPGDFIFLSTGPNYDGGDLFGLLGATQFDASLQPVSLFWWTDPDESILLSSTRDFISLSPTSSWSNQVVHFPPFPIVGWLLVSDAPTAAVPEASSFLVWLGLGMIGCQKLRRPRKTR